MKKSGTTEIRTRSNLLKINQLKSGAGEGTPVGLARSGATERRALTPIQNQSSENDMMGKPSTSTASANGSLNKIQKRKRVTKKKATTQAATEEKAVQTGDDCLENLVTGAEAPVEYWEALAEERRVALEEALKENEILNERVEELEKENAELADIVEQAKQMAEMVNSLSEEHNCTADESGIGKDADSTL